MKMEEIQKEITNSEIESEDVSEYEQEQMEIVSKPINVISLKFSMNIISYIFFRCPPVQFSYERG